jgi:hypothetical protein
MGITPVSLVNLLTFFRHPESQWSGFLLIIVWLPFQLNVYSAFGLFDFGTDNSGVRQTNECRLEGTIDQFRKPRPMEMARECTEAADIVVTFLPQERILLQ